MPEKKKDLDYKFIWTVISFFFISVITVTLAWGDQKSKNEVQDYKIKSNTQKIERIYIKLDDINKKLDALIRENRKIN